MIDCTEIKSNLAYCHNRYKFYSSKDSPSSGKLAEMHCKLAIIELHGWVETTLEEICREFVGTHAASYKQLQKFAEKKIRKNNGIGYENHIRPLFCHIFGFKLTQELEFKLSLTEGFSEILESIMMYRNKLAHSYIQHSSTIPSNMAPSYLIVNYLPRIAKKLDEIKSHVGDSDAV